MAENKTPVKPLRDFFGKKDGQSLADFAAEVRELTPEDREQLHEGLTNGSLTY